MNSLPRTVVRAASTRDPNGIPLIAISFSDAAAARAAATQLAAYLVAPVNLVLVPPDAEFSLFQSGSLLVILQRTPSADLDSEAANTLLATLQGMLEGGVPITIDGQVIGAVGVSGVKSSEDAEIASAGIAALTA
jgi:uncharacterized protein GlcG (DUF336 family)